MRDRRERRSDGFAAVDLEVTPLQPDHQDAWQARPSPVRVACEPHDVSARWQIGRVGMLQEPNERVEAHGVDELHHGVSP